MRLALAMAAFVIAAATCGLPAVAATVAPSTVSLAAELVSLIVPIAAERARAEANFTRTYREQILDSAIGKAREGRFPGANDAGIRAGVAVLDNALNAMLPRFARDIRTAIVRALTPAQVAEADSFFRSATGRKVLSLRRARVTVQPAVDRMRRDRSGRLEPGDLAAATGDQSWLSQLTSTERAELQRYSTSPAAEKLDDVIARVQREHIGAFNREMEPYAAAIDVAVTTGINDAITAQLRAGR